MTAKVSNTHHMRLLTFVIFSLLLFFVHFSSIFVLFNIVLCFFVGFRFWHYLLDTLFIHEQHSSNSKKWFIHPWIPTPKYTHSAARAPTLNALLASNSTFALLRLNSWLEQQCPISYFVVQYKVHSQSDWIMLSNNIIPEQGQIIISDLIPATWYDIIMIANSEAGQSKAQYVFSTLTIDGGKWSNKLRIFFAFLM